MYNDVVPTKSHQEESYNMSKFCYKMTFLFISKFSSNELQKSKYYSCKSFQVNAQIFEKFEDF